MKMQSLGATYSTSINAGHFHTVTIPEPYETRHRSTGLLRGLGAPRGGGARRGGGGGGHRGGGRPAPGGHPAAPRPGGRALPAGAAIPHGFAPGPGHHAGPAGHHGPHGGGGHGHGHHGHLPWHPGHGHPHGGRRGRGWWGPPWDYYYPNAVYYVADVYTVEAYNAGRVEVLGQGVSWSAAVLGAQVYMQHNAPYPPAAYVRIVPGYEGESVCEWRGTPTGWALLFCNADTGFYGVGSDPELPPPKGSYAALAVLGAVSVGALAWMWLGARRGSRYGFTK